MGAQNSKSNCIIFVQNSVHKGLTYAIEFEPG